MTEQEKTSSGGDSGEEGLRVRMHPSDSLEIERDIEATLSNMRGTLGEIQENLSPDHLFAPLKRFLGSPAGKMLLALGAVTIASRRPVLAATAVVGTVIFLYRKDHRHNR